MLILTFVLITFTPLPAEEKDCYIEETNCREQSVNCREEQTDCKEKCVQERCFDFVEEGKECICIKKQKTECKETITVCDKERVCDEKLVCEEIPGENPVDTPVAN